MLEESNIPEWLSTIDDMCLQLDMAWCIDESVQTPDYFTDHHIKHIHAAIQNLLRRSMSLIIDAD